MSYANKTVRAVAKAIVDVEKSPDHTSCVMPAYCMARAAIRACGDSKETVRLNWLLRNDPHGRNRSFIDACIKEEHMRKKGEKK